MTSVDESKTTPIPIPNPKAFVLPLKNLVVGPDRGRKTFTRIMELAESIQKLGLIHPIVVTQHPTQHGKYLLVAGERRYRASIMAGRADVLATLRTDSDDVLAEIELEENVCRSDISYEEEGNILRKIIDKKRQQDPTWGIKETAELTGRSVGDVSTKMKTAQIFQERPDIRVACANLPHHAAVKKIKQIEEAERVQRLSDQGQITLTTDLLHGSCIDLIKNVDAESIDLLLTDPPYGLERLEELRKSGTSRMSGHTLMSEHHNQSLGEVIKLLTQLAPELRRALKPGAHFYMFCGFQYVGDFISALDPHLEFQPPVLIWDRGKGSSPGYGYNYLSRAECIIYGHRPPRGRRLNKSMYNIIECSDVPRNLRRYPTEKPVPLLQTLIKNSTDQNAMVLDPFAGSASTLIAARNCGRRGLGFEINQESYLRAQQRLIDGDET